MVAGAYPNAPISCDSAAVISRVSVEQPAHRLEQPVVLGGVAMRRRPAPRGSP